MALEADSYPIIFGRAGMVAHVNRFLAQPHELLLAENVTFENDLVQKDHASHYYDPDALPPESATGTWAPSVAWGGVLTGLAAPISPPASLGTVASVSVTSPADLIEAPVLLSLPTPGSTFVLMAIARAAAGELPTAVTDTRGNPYQLLGARVGVGAEPSVALWGTQLVAPLVPGTDRLTLTLPSITEVPLLLHGTAYPLPAPRAQRSVTAGGTGTSVTVGPMGLLVYPVLLITALAGNTHAAAASFTWTGGSAEESRNDGIAGALQLRLGRKHVPFAPPAIVAQADWEAGAESTPAGTVATTAALDTVTGTGTSFLTTFVPGDLITVGTEMQRVKAVLSATQLTTQTVWQTTQTGATYLRRAGPRVITASLLGTIYKDLPQASGNTGKLNGVQLISGLTTTRRRGRFVVAGKESSGNPRKLFYFNGVNAPSVLAGDGATMAPIAGPAADWTGSHQPVNGIVHNDRLAAFGNYSDPHRLYFSDPANHETFTGTSVTQLRIASQIGERLWGAAHYQGVLFLWKYPRGIFYIDDSALDLVQWSYRIRAEALGCAPSPHAVVPLDDDVLFMAPDGHVHLLSAVNTLGGLRDSDLTRVLGLHEWMKAHIAVPALDQLASAYNPYTKIAYFGVRSRDATSDDFENDLLLRFDFGGGRGGMDIGPGRDPVRFSYSRVWVPNALTIKRRSFTDVPALLIGETATAQFVDPARYGTRIERDIPSQTDVLIGFPLILETPELDLGDVNPAYRHRRKTFVGLEAVLVGEDLALQTLTVAVSVDGEARGTLTFQQAAVRRIYRPLSCGDGYTISFRATLPMTSTMDLRAIALILYYRINGQDHSRRS
jgi:hypothetical protein